MIPPLHCALRCLSETRWVWHTTLPAPVSSDHEADRIHPDLRADCSRGVIKTASSAPGATRSGRALLTECCRVLRQRCWTPAAADIDRPEQRSVLKSYQANSRRLKCLTNRCRHERASWWAPFSSIHGFRLRQLHGGIRHRGGADDWTAMRRTWYRSVLIGINSMGWRTTGQHRTEALRRKPAKHAATAGASLSHQASGPGIYAMRAARRSLRRTRHLG